MTGEGAAPRLDALPHAGARNAVRSSSPPGLRSQGPDGLGHRDRPPGPPLPSARLGPAKWCLQLAGRTSRALGEHASELEAKGSTLESSSVSSGADLEQLDRGPDSALVEQIAFAGRVVTLAVTVRTSS